MKNINFGNILSLVAISISCAVFLFVVWPLTRDGFFPTMDDVQVVRIEEMYNELAYGQFPVRFVSGFGNGAGFPFFNFYPPLAYYFGAIIYSLGFSIIQATKLTFMLGFFLAFTGVIILLKKYTTLGLAFLSAALFISVPYFNYDVYTRGALAEFIAFSLLPWSLYAVLSLRENPRLNWMTLSAVLFAAVVLAHSFIGYVYGGIVALIFLLPPLTYKKFKYYIFSIILGLGISAFFWLPVLLEQKYTVYSKSYFGRDAYLSNFFDIGTIFGVSKQTTEIVLPTLGIVVVVCLFVSFLLGVYYRRKIKHSEYLILMSGLGILLLFSTFEYSSIIWSVFPFLKYLQFPWRLFGFISLFSVFGITLVITGLKRTYISCAFIIGLLGLQLFLYYPKFFRPSQYNFVEKYYADDECGITLWGAELMSVWASDCFHKTEKTRELLYPPYKTDNRDLVVDEFVQADNGQSIYIKKSGKSGTLLLRKYYFPGWEAVDGSGKALILLPYGKYGQVAVRVPEGPVSIKIESHGTIAQKIANIISYLSLIVTGACVMYIMKASKNKKKK